MRKIILSQHVTLDGFVAGPHGEMNWIKVDEEIFDLVATMTAAADAALYGRVTYQMMDQYWPTAADKPNASRHDKEHAAWYNRCEKIVLSKTMQHEKRNKTTFIGENIPGEIEKLKSKPGENILIFGSPSAAHTLMHHNLIDEYWLFVNPVILGQGIPLFANITEKIKLQPVTTQLLSSGVTALHYSVQR